MMKQQLREDTLQVQQVQNSPALVCKRQQQQNFAAEHSDDNDCSRQEQLRKTSLCRGARSSATKLYNTIGVKRNALNDLFEGLFEWATTCAIRLLGNTLLQESETD